jgi:hypothetical protein
MEQRGWARVGPVGGILAVVTFVASMFGMRADLGVRPGGPAEEIARPMTAGMDSGAGITVVMPLFLSIFFLNWFLRDLHHRLQQGVDPAARRIATVFLAGGLVLVAGAFVSYWVPLWAVWVLFTSITLLVRSEQPSRKQSVSL